MLILFSVILKDVTFTVMSELLQFMYEGQVNVKHSDLATFMKIAETLQIKGLTTTLKSPSPSHNNNQSSLTSKNSGLQSDIQSSSSSNNVLETRINTSGGNGSAGSSGGGGAGGSSIGNLSKLENLSTSSSASSSLPIKRSSDYNNDSFSIYSKKLAKRSSDINESEINQETIDNMTTDEVFLPPIPHVSMIESRFDINSVKREAGDSLTSPLNMRNSGPAFNYNEYNSVVYGGSKNIEYPNDLHDFKGINHMDIPAGILFFITKFYLKK